MSARWKYDLSLELQKQSEQREPQALSNTQLYRSAYQEALAPSSLQTIDPALMQIHGTRHDPATQNNVRERSSFIYGYMPQKNGCNLSQPLDYMDCHARTYDGSNDSSSQSSDKHLNAPEVHIHDVCQDSPDMTGLPTLDASEGDLQTFLPHEIADLQHQNAQHGLAQTDPRGRSGQTEASADLNLAPVDQDLLRSNDFPYDMFDIPPPGMLHSPIMTDQFEQAYYSPHQQPDVNGFNFEDHNEISNNNFDWSAFDPNEWLLPESYPQDTSSVTQQPVPDDYHYAENIFSPEPEQSSRSSKGKRKRQSTPALSFSENPQCISCSKRFRPTQRTDRCNRCAAKYERATAIPPVYHLAPSVPSVAAARQLIYPHVSRKGPREGDDVPSPQALAWNTDAYVAKLLDAVNTAIDPNDCQDWAARQQHVFNGKAKMEPTYSNEHVTARIRALFHELLLFHTGSPQPLPSSSSSATAASENNHFYSIGGDNSGYPISPTQPFSARFENICAVLRVNKRVVMDVIEGRGVQGFVGNPWVYHRRKASNNDCNVKKKVIMERGKGDEEGLDEEGGAGNGGKGKGKGKRTGGDGEVEGGPSTRVKKAKRGGRKGEDDGDDDWVPKVGDGGEARSYGSGRERLLNSLYGGRRR